MNTTNTKETIEPKEKQKATQFLGDLDLRDYFAAKAMQAIITNDEMIKRMNNLECYKGIKSGLCIAKEAYTIADCMLEARND